MIKSLLLLIFLSSFFLKTYQTGQWSPAELDSSLVQINFSEVKEYAFSQLSINGIIPEDFQFKSASNVYTQIVAGTNWKFDIIYSKEGEERTISVVIWQQLPNSLEKFKFSHVSVKITKNSDQTNLMGGWTESIDESFDNLKTALDVGLKNLAEQVSEIKDLTFFKVEKIQTQIVHGKNYKLLLQFTDKATGQNVNYQVIVWQNDGEMSFISYNSETRNMMRDRTHPILGGWTEIDQENLDSAAEKALAFANNAILTSKKLTDDYSFVKVEKASSQVVAGMKFKFVMVFKNNVNGDQKRFEVVVWRKLDGFNTGNEIYELININDLNLL